MLLLLPTPLVPLLTGLALVLSALIDVARGGSAFSRVPFALADGWYSLGAAAVLIACHAQLPEWGQWPVYLLALAAQFVVDGIASLARMRVAVGLRARELAAEMGLVYRVDALLAPIGLLAALAAADVPAAALLVLPLVVLISILAREREHRIAHSLELGALLHDIGKIAIADEIINKPGPLDDDEWAVMKTHTIEGQRMLDRVGGPLADVGVVVRASHERFDGGGYPDGLAGQAIPLAARLVSVCDAYNAMTTDRSYRKALPLDVAARELRANAGTQFDPAVVEALLDVVGAPAEPIAWQLTLGPGEPEPAPSRPPARSGPQPAR